MSRVRLLAVSLCMLVCGGSSQATPSPYRPAVYAALAVTLGSLGTGMTVTAQSCVNRDPNDCRSTIWTSALAVIGTALATGSIAFLNDMPSVPPPASTVYERLP